jgi:hypothetical protein
MERRLLQEDREKGCRVIMNWPQLDFRENTLLQSHQNFQVKNLFRPMLDFMKKLPAMLSRNPLGQVQKSLMILQP